MIYLKYTSLEHLQNRLQITPEDFELELLLEERQAIADQQHSPRKQEETSEDLFDDEHMGKHIDGYDRDDLGESPDF